MWFKEIADNIIKENPGKQGFIVETGITPSGPIHLGNLREALVAAAMAWTLKKQGKKVRFVYFSDTLDPLRRRYPFLPAEYEKYVGWPLARIPAPPSLGGDTLVSPGQTKVCPPDLGGGTSVPPGGLKSAVRGEVQFYSDYFVQPFIDSLKKLSVDIEVIYAHEFYRAGKMTEAVDIALEHRDRIAKIIEEVSGRKLEEDWQPFNAICKKCGRIDQTKIKEIDIKNHRVKYRCQCGNEDWADYSKGEGKLAWRIDWPARWWVLKVDVEPAGKDLFASGGACDVGERIIKEVYNVQPPHLVHYEWIYLRGAGKMASSTGVGISIADFLKIMPPQAVRYLIFRTEPMRHIDFHPGQDTAVLYDEFARLQDRVKTNKASVEEKSLYDISVTDLPKVYTELSEVPFEHLVSIYQASAGNQDEIERLLQRSGYRVADRQALQEQIGRVAVWLQTWAPEEVKFEVQKELPDNIKISVKQKELLSGIIERMQEGKESQEGEKLHNFIYEEGKKLGLTPKETFEPIYLALLGKNSGPKAGFFLAMWCKVDKEMVIERFKEAIYGPESLPRTG